MIKNGARTLAPAVAQAPAEDIAAAAAASSSARRNTDALNALDDTRVLDIKPLVPPQILMEDLPLTRAAEATVTAARRAAARVIAGADDRLLVIVGPCSIHDPAAAREYAQRLAAYAEGAAADLLVVMRVYFEKPRTTVGWKGLVNDPFLDNTFKINKGLRLARELLIDINELGLPAGCEFLDTLTPQYFGDLVSWGAIGARTTESQVHRELASGLSVPVGFKNGTDGNVGIAIDAIRAASASHHFLSVTKQGLSAIVQTTGNPDCHIILRGGAAGPNYSREHLAQYTAQLDKAAVCPRLMVDCSHGNSQKKHRQQIVVADDICAQLAGESGTRDCIMGVMVESHLKEGRQDLKDDGLEGLEYGQSITDACISFEDTVKVLDNFRKAVTARRAARSTGEKLQKKPRN